MSKTELLQQIKQIKVKTRSDWLQLADVIKKIENSPIGLYPVGQRPHYDQMLDLHKIVEHVRIFLTEIEETFRISENTAADAIELSNKFEEFHAECMENAKAFSLECAFLEQKSTSKMSHKKLHEYLNTKMNTRLEMYQESEKYKKIKSDYEKSAALMESTSIQFNTILDQYALYIDQANFNDSNDLND